MKRRIMLAALLFGLSAGASLAGRVVIRGAADGYTQLSRACMHASDAIRAHPDAVAVVVAAAFALLALLAVASAALLLRRTARAMRALQAGRIYPLPPRLETLSRKLELDGAVDLIESSELFAFCYGLRRPRIMLSRALADELRDDELEAVLRHEAAHMRRWDPLRIVAARSLSVALAFVPITPAVLQAYLCRRELKADNESVNAMGDVMPLASALQRMLMANQRQDLGSLAIGALSATDLRIDRLLGEEASPRAFLTDVSRRHVFAFTLVVAVTLCVLVSTAHAATGVRPCLPC